jgi:hypothetical protein
MPDAELPTPAQETASAPAVAPHRRPWYRLHWSTWIVIAAVLTFFALMNLPGRGGYHRVIFIDNSLLHEHGWPFVYLDRYDPPGSAPNLSPFAPPPFTVSRADAFFEHARDHSFFPWAESHSIGFLGWGFRDGDPIWLNKSNWSFTGNWYLYKKWLSFDILIALFATIPLAVAYELWSRRRWHYSLRFLLLCVLLFAAGMAWWRTGVNNYEREIIAAKALHEKGYEVKLQCDAPVFLRIFIGNNNLLSFAHVREITSSVNTKAATDADLEHLGDLTRLVELWLPGTPITDEGLKQIHDLPRLSSIGLFSTKITGEGFKAWKNLPNLQSLQLDNTFITDAGLRHLMELSNLSDLTLSRTKVTDEGLRHLAGMPKLKHLQLDGLPITDDGLKYLENMPQLGELEINGTKVTSTGIDKLQRALPNCQINWMMEVANPDETDQPTSEAENEEK